jgi:hypothetical protein
MAAAAFTVADAAGQLAPRGSFSPAAGFRPPLRANSYN